jgi:glucose-1-phosphate thymidylyltransferase
MKGIILAGGTGSRLDPLTRVTNKHLLPVYDQPMIRFPIALLAAAGIDRILVVTGGKDADRFAPLLGDGTDLGVCLEYVEQPRPAGIADALGLARAFADGDAVCLVLGDNIFEHSIRRSVDAFRAQGGGARVILAEVDRPESYGVPVLEGDRVVRIDEKPKIAASHYAVTGCYLYDSAVFDIVMRLVPSGRGELEITDVNNAYIAKGALRYDYVDGYWVDCGESFDAYLRAQNLVATKGANRP